jgi:hypothetical protein
MRMTVDATGANADILDLSEVSALLEGINHILVTGAAGFRLVLPIYMALGIRLPQHTYVRSLFFTYRRITTMTFLAANTLFLMSRELVMLV